eukprot:TRINITY_DN2254_c0_g1_i2.p1 TRINITY_DN2254_c0_g1~~TRINITY_DN2254_c0_g1_i2.p1  ORF type:complete len:299 (-),score=12.98 TRINITY_DN2254_c0_g1_i2:1-897(-)
MSWFLFFKIWESSLDGSRPSLIYSSSSRLERGAAFDASTSYLYYTIRRCTGGEGYTECFKTEAEIYRIRIGAGFVSVPQHVASDLAAACQLFVDLPGQSVSVLSTQSTLTLRRLSSMAASLGDTISEIPISGIQFNNASSDSQLCTSLWTSWSAPLQSLFVSTLSGAFILANDGSATEPRLFPFLRGATGPVAFDQVDQRTLFLSVGDTIRALSLSGSPPYEIERNSTVLAFSRGSWVTELMAIQCSSSCSFRPGLDDLDFSNLMVSVVVILGICMATGPLLLMYSERAQRPARQPRT